MTQEHITITEEVQKDGQLVTETRETLQTTVETPEVALGRQAYGVTHPDYVSAQDRTYVLNEATGMSESVPAPVADEAPDTETEEEGLADVAEEEDVEVDEEDEEDEEEELEEDAEAEVCGHPIGNGECQLAPGHDGQHRINV
jgi:hypothetical protein